MSDEIRMAILGLYHRNPKHFNMTGVAQAYGISRHQVRLLVQPDYAERVQARNRKRREEARAEFRPAPNWQEERRRRMAALGIDGRDLTARMLGDPLPGYSALDQRQGRAG